MTQVFDEEIINQNLEKFRRLLKKGESVRFFKFKFDYFILCSCFFLLKIDKYYKDCQRNTDNAWIETTVVNYHDEVGELLSKVPLMVSFFNYVLRV